MKQGFNCVLSRIVYVSQYPEDVGKNFYRRIKAGEAKSSGLCEKP